MMETCATYVQIISKICQKNIQLYVENLDEKSVNSNTLVMFTNQVFDTYKLNI